MSSDIKSPLTAAQLSSLEAVLTPREVVELRNLYALSQGKLHIPYAKITPTEVQKKFLMSNSSDALFGGGVGGGKALLIQALIPTPGGWKENGSIVAGDVIFGADGRPTKVVRAFGPHLPAKCYRLTFDDGSSIDCSAEHLWLTFTNADRKAITRSDPQWKERRRLSRPSRATGKRGSAVTSTLAARNSAEAAHRRLLPPREIPGHVMTTQQMVDSFLDVKGNTNHAIPTCGPLQYPPADLPIDPYVLGVWLGDGSTNSGSIVVTDQSIEDRIAAHYTPGMRQVKPGKTWWSCTYKGLVTDLKKLGVSGNKHIPRQYLQASVDQRMELMRGLMDTDGTTNARSGSVEFNTTNKALADGMRELILSMGWKACIREGRAKLYGVDHGPAYDIQWTPSDYVFHVERKRCRQKLTTRSVTKWRYVKQFKEIEPQPMRCLEVEADDHLFVAGTDMLVTHNSKALCLSGVMYADVPNYKALFVRKTTRDLEAPGGLIATIREWLHKSGARWNHDYKRFYLKNNITIEFGHLETDSDADRYQGQEYNFIGLDEAGQHTPNKFNALWQRIRRVKTDIIPSRMRLTANPGGPNHNFLKERYIDPKTATGEYYPATLKDNPFLDQEDYLSRLSKLSKLAQDQMIHGLWVHDSEGLVYSFKRAENGCDVIPDDQYKVVIGIDLGSSEKQKTTGFAVVLWSKFRKEAYIAEAWAESGLTPASIAEVCMQTMERWGDEAVIVMDEGALGRGYANEMRARYGLPVIAAQKKDKNGFIKLMNGDIEQGRLFIVRSTCEELMDEYETLMWDATGRNFMRNMSDHVSDAALYAWRHSLNWLQPEARAEPRRSLVDPEQIEREIMENAAADERRQWWE